MENMDIYELVRSVPTEAQKAFDNGRFRGTDINPMWRIKKLTEMFGPAGFGWYYEVTSERAETVGDTVMAIVDLKLYIKVGGEWSKPIYGTGGNVLLAKGRASDEGYKMALTDALSVACKALGIGADIYFGADRTKYTAANEGRTVGNRPYSGNGSADAGRLAAAEQAPQYSPPPAGQMSLSGKPQCMRCGKEIVKDAVYKYSMQHFKQPLCYACQQKARAS